MLSPKLSDFRVIILVIVGESKQLIQIHFNFQTQTEVKLNLHFMTLITCL